MQRKRRRKIKQTYIKIIFLVIVLLMAIYLIKGVTAKYKTSASSSANVDIAYYIFKEQSISQDLKLPSILPSSQAYTFTFSVANHDQNERTQTALEYSMELVTTTNIPFQFTVHKYGEQTNLITQTQTVQDSDNTYFKHFTIAGDEFGFSQDEQNVYVLEILFPLSLNSAEYEGIIEYMQLIINSRQKISV